MTDTIQIVPMNKDHIPVLCQLEKECFAHPWSYRSLEEQLTNPISHFFVAVMSGEAAGYVGMYQVLNEAYFHNIAVFKRFRRKGVASALMQKVDTFAVEKGLCSVSLEVRVSNLQAIRLYERFGYIPVGRRKRFYTLPEEDAGIYTKFYNTNPRPKQ